jgi:hypothetical protein
MPIVFMAAACTEQRFGETSKGIPPGDCEATQVSPQGVGYPGTPGIHGDEQVEDGAG